MHIRYKKLLLASTAAVSALVFPGCSHPAENAAKDTRFQITDSFLNSLLIDTVQKASARSQLTLTGTVAPDETKMAKIYPMVSGVAGDVRVQLGDLVHKGETLVVLKSPEMAGFAKDYVSAEADIRNARRELESARDMYKGGLASQKDLEQAQSDYQKALAEGKRASEVMTIDKSNGDGYEVKSPLTGYVVEKNINSNTGVRADNSQNLFTIANLSTVYVLANVYESDIAKISVGDPVKITTLSYPNKVFDGKIDKIDNMLDPDDKVMHARIRIDNPGNLLKPGMFANISINAKSGEDMPFINANDIVFDNDTNYVITLDGNSKAHVQPIQVAKRVENRAYIGAGIKPGDRVVASRQVYLYESLKDQ